ncbi:MAG: ABC transporter permease [Oscillospiraceae bacterium]|nr:ABC transporter permease [Oscillospiraceae bacterium]
MVSNSRRKRAGNAFAKDVFREIFKTKNRFLSIFLIVAIGVGFFAGLTASGPDMKLTGDTYFDDQNLSDFRLVSTLGFTDQDVQALRAAQGVQSVVPGHWVDTVLQVDGDSEVVKAMGYDFDKLAAGNADMVNIPVLLEGRFPQSPDECVVEATGEILGVTFQLGETITLASGKTDADLTDTLASDRFTIVGIIQSPLYISIDRGTSSIGSGKVNAFIMVPNEAFLEDYYTEIYLRIDGGAGLSSYSEEYRQKIEELTPVLKKMGEERAQIRLEEVREEAGEKIADAQKELDDGIVTQQQELADARQKLDDARQELSDGERKLADATQEYYDSIAEAEQQIADARQELRDGEQEYASGLREYEKGEAAFEKAQAQALPQIEAAEATLIQMEQNLTQGQAQYEQIRALVPSVSTLSATLSNPAADPAGTAQMIGQLSALAQADPAQSWAEDLADYLSAPAAMTPQDNAYHLAVVRQVNQELDKQNTALQEGRVQLNEGKDQLASQKKKLAAADSQLTDAAEHLKKARRTLDDGWTELAEKEKEFQDGKADGWQELLDARQKLADGRIELVDGEQEYEEGKAESDQEIADAQKDLDQAKKDLAELETPEWYVLDRTDYPGHSDFGEDSGRIAAIARVFPVFFLLVAALVCLTTMTRMVEEQRTQVGTLKALGYRSGAIMSKFLIYALVATVAGSVAGLAVGMYLFPTVIYNAYGILYTMIPARTPFRMGIAAASTFAAAATVLATVLFSCGREMMEQPASLMRPKAPKVGKRVLLERIGLIWNRLSFSHKVTFRNLFRYKKRMLMTVVGIAGCSALMLTGFGMYDSIRDIVGIQFGELYHYDLTTVLQDDLSDDNWAQVDEVLRGDLQIIQSINLRQESLEIKADSGKSYNLYLFVPEDPAQLDAFITLRTRTEHTPLSLPEEGVILTEKAANFLGVQAGDSITVTDVDHRAYTVEVAAITEHYTSHYLYMTPQAYEQCFGKAPIYNMVQSILAEPGSQAQDQLIQKLVATDGVLAVSDTSTIKDQFKDMIHSMTYVMLVLIISAGALAVVVLYNLSNINITERIREIATIKVLGFYDREVSAYIYRENILLTLMGTIAGLGLGVLLHHYVVITAETDIVMFGRTVKWASFVFSAALTLAFSMLVNIVMHFKLKKVDMVESLKSIE